MRLKWWFKANQNKLYKKYSFDPHGHLIRRAHITKTFKFLLNYFRYNILFKLYNKRPKNRFFKFKKRFIKTFKKIKFKYKFDYNPKQRKKRKALKKILKNWNYKFWDKFKNNYFNKNFTNLKQKKTPGFLFLKAYTVLKNNLLGRSFYIRYRRIKSFKKKKYNTRMAKGRVSIKNTAKRKRRKLMKSIAWMRVIKYRKKPKSWWLLRVTNKKAAFFYGFTQLKKFRYINKLNSRSIPLSTFYSHKLESMINITLFRLNFFDNIFIVNNFIRISGIVLVNGKKVLYPFRFIKTGDIISFHPSSFKRMFNIFLKRSRFNKSFTLKKMKNKNRIFKFTPFKLLKSVKNFINVPAYIEYNYKIMHFMLWRLPHENEFLSMNFRYFNTHVWAFETQLQYN